MKEEESDCEVEEKDLEEMLGSEKKKEKRYKKGRKK